jgi:hypothetical protein
MRLHCGYSPITLRNARPPSHLSSSGSRDAEAPLWGQVNNSTDYSSLATQISVYDSTLFAVNDLVIVPFPTGAGHSQLDEVILVTSSGGNSLTVVRNLAG